MSSTLFQYHLETQAWDQFETNLALFETSTVLINNSLYIYAGVLESREFEYNMYKIGKKNMRAECLF